MHKIPHYFFYYYMPKRYLDVSKDSIYARNLIYNFKDGINYNEVCNLIVEKVNSLNLNNLTLATVPASSICKNNIRYKKFSDILCNMINCENGFKFINITEETEPKHCGGYGYSTYEIDDCFFKNKNILIFDDIMTTGKSIKKFALKLINAGAKIICAITIGKTYNDQYFTTRPLHPYTGNVC